MKIQVGKQYITRCGLITGPIESNEHNSFYPLKALILGKPEFEYVTWDKSGIYTNLPNSENGLDLVEEYVPNNEVRVKEEVLKIIDEEINKINESKDAGINDVIDNHVYGTLNHLRSKIQKL